MSDTIPSTMTCHAVKSITIPVPITVERRYDVASLRTELVVRGKYTDERMHIAQRSLLVEEGVFSATELQQLVRVMGLMVADQLGAEIQ